MVRRTIAFVAVAFLAGGAVGAFAFRQPAYEERKEKTVAQQTSHDAVMLDDSWMWRYTENTGPKETIRWKKIYAPSPDGGCALISEEGSTTKEGPGSVAISSDQEKHVEASKDVSILNIRDVSTLRMDLPRLTLGLGAEVQPLDGMKVKPAASLGFRFSKNLTLRAKVAIQPTDIKKSDVGLMLEFPL